jgi:Raf kinase inhibitor-like YbhB/YbcL family protein
MVVKFQDMLKLEDEFRTNAKVRGRELVISSPAFAAGGYIPAKYSCDAQNINPPLSVSGVPQGTRTLAIIMEDVDRPIRPWVHWVAWNIPPVEQLEEDHRTCLQGMNDFIHCGYFGPCPSSGLHHYHLKVYALDLALNLHQRQTGKAELEKAMQGHILAYGVTVFLYERARKSSQTGP